KTRRSATKQPSQQVRSLLGSANSAFIEHDLDTAEALLAEAIGLDGRVYTAWKTLGEIHLERGSKQKCVMAWILAAHLRPKDAELWARCAKMSAEVGYHSQALYCFNHAILAEPQNPTLLYERAMLYKELGDLNKAITSMQKVHQLLPDNREALLELTSLLVSASRHAEATKMYADLYAAARDDALLNPSEPKQFTSSDLNVFSELLAAQRQFRLAITNIKQISRWLQDREDQTFWDQFDNDAEYDDRRLNVPEFIQYCKDNGIPLNASAYSLPLDLRTKLALYRLKLGNLEEAKVHADIVLYSAPNQYSSAESYADLFLKLGDGMLESRQYELALNFYVPLSDLDGQSTAHLVMSMGDCLSALGDYEQAEEAYRTVILHDDKNVDAKIALVRVWEKVGRINDALLLVKYAIWQRDRDSQATSDNHRLTTETADNSMIDPALLGITEELDDDKYCIIPNAPLIPNKGTEARKNQKASLTLAEREAAERDATEQVLSSYNSLVQDLEGISENSPIAVAEWLMVASTMVEMFVRTKSFFPSDRNKVFSGVALAQNRASKLGVDETLIGLGLHMRETLLADADTSQPQSDFQDAEPVSVTDESLEWRGLKISEWFRICMEYSLNLAKYEDVEDAYTVLNQVKGANVFFQHPKRNRTMLFVHLACTIYAEDYSEMQDVIRQILNKYPFETDGYRLFPLCLSRKEAALKFLCHANHQKFFLRQIKSLDALLDDSEEMDLEGRSKLNVPTTEDPVLLVLYGQILFCSRSYVPSLNYFMRAYALMEKHPMILFSIGIAFLHRARQRQTANRHQQFLQALSFLIEYRDVRSAEGLEATIEAQYNIARAFHFMGLTTAAAKMYLALLENSEATDPSSCTVLRSCAYNLQLIYTISGNPRMARTIVDRYLAI
ncbi:hypothetical protein CANCADRAFT_14922, partial [Tortispora caseinolytica NRRL Y-17796]